MHLIPVDIGNSAIKLAHASVVNNKITLSTKERWADSWHENLKSFRQKLPQDSLHWVISSVHRSRADALTQMVASLFPNDFVSLLTEIPIETDVDHPEQVGKDRLLAGVASLRRTVDSIVSDWIVIDAGTAVTVDWVNREDGFLGGNIYPGADSNFAQLASRTDALPNLDYASRLQSIQDNSIAAPLALGKNTRAAILSGVYQAQIGALRQHVSGLFDKANRVFENPLVEIVATGGGWVELDHACEWLNSVSLAEYLLDAVPEAHSVVEDESLVLRGIVLAILHR